MFDLFRSRDKAVRALLTGMLVLVAFSMVTYLIPGSGSGYGSDPSADASVVAQIGKDSITSRDLSRKIQEETRNRQLPPELISVYAKQIANRLIDERTLAYEAERIGIRVSADETDNAVLDAMPPQLIKDGKVDGATLNAVLQQQGLTLADLKSQTARQLAVNRLGQIISQGVVVTPQEIEAEYRRKNEKVKLAYAVLTSARYQTEAEPTDAEMKTFYDSHKSDFKVKEKKSFGLITLDPQRIGAGIVPTEAQLRQEYNNRRNDFQTPERARARHILIKSDATNDAQSKAKAEALLKQIQGGADFAKLARENSQDPGSAVQGGELGWTLRGQMVPEFEKATFSLQPGQVSGLVKTMYGYHIVQTEAHEQPHLQAFEEVRPQLTADYQKRLATQQMQTLADKAIAELRKDPLHPEKAAEAVNAPLMKVESIQAGDPVPGVGTSKEFDTAVASLRKGEITAGPVVLPGGQAVLASVTDLQAAHPASFEEAKSEVRNRAQQDKLEKILSARATELAAKAKSLGGLEKAGKALNIEVKTSADVDRQGTIETVGPLTGMADAFTRPVGSILGPTPVSAGRAVMEVLAKTPADLAGLPAQSVSIREDLKQKKGRDREQFFLDGLRERLKADGKLKIHQDVIDRLVQSYGQRG